MSLTTKEKLQKISNYYSCHYIHSTGTSIEDSKGKKVTVFFYPSIVFPIYIELSSVTVLYNNCIENAIDKTIHFSIKNKDSNLPLNIPKLSITHQKGKLTSTFNFPEGSIIGPHQPFYFHYEEGHLEDASLMLEYNKYKMSDEMVNSLF